MKYLALSVLALLALPAHAATLSAVPSATTAAIGDTVTVRVWVDPEGVSINNAEAVLRFPADSLEVLSVSKAGSAFSFWVEEPSYSNAAGTVSFNGGVPNPGISRGAELLLVTFRTQAPGSAALSFTGAAVRANDGEGTDVLDGTSGTRIVIAAGAAPQTAAPVAETTAPGRPTALTIASATHPDEDAWYASDAPSFSWTLPAGISRVQLIADRSANATPSVTYARALTEKTVEGLADGMWYFRMRYDRGGTWSEIATRMVRIDTTEPRITDYEVRYDALEGRVVIAAEGSDAGSGIAAYELSVKGKKAVSLDPAEVEAGTASMVLRPSGTKPYTLTAIDGAGNRTTVEGTVETGNDSGDPILFALGTLEVRLVPVLIWMLLLSLLTTALALAGWMHTRRQYLAEHPRKHLNATRGMHRQLRSFKKALERDLETLAKAGGKRGLTREEQTIQRRIQKDLERIEADIEKTLEDL